MNQYMQAANSTVKPEKISYLSDNEKVVGNLYLPVNFDKNKSYPAVIIGGAFTTVKEQMGGIYADQLAQRGIISLAIDYRHYGESDGEIRQYEDQNLKADDLLAGIKYLRNNYNVSSASILGICASATTAIYAAAKSDNVDSVAMVAGSFADKHAIPNMDVLVETSRQARENYEKTGKYDMMPVYGADIPGALIPVTIPYYVEKEQGNIPEWKNTLAVMSLESWASGDAFEKAKEVKVPTLMIHSKEATLPEKAEEIHSLLNGEKELVWLEGQHTDFYNKPEQVTKAADLVAEFLK